MMMMILLCWWCRRHHYSPRVCTRVWQVPLALLLLSVQFRRIQCFYPLVKSQLFVMETTATAVTCTVSVNEGIPYLTLAWFNQGFWNACTNVKWLFLKSHSCTARFPLGATRLYATVQAPSSRGIQNMTLECIDKTASWPISKLHE